MDIGFDCKSRIEVNIVEGFETTGIRHQDWMSSERIHPPRFRFTGFVSDVSGVTVRKSSEAKRISREEIPRMSPVYSTARSSPSIRNITAPAQ